MEKDNSIPEDVKKQIEVKRESYYKGVDIGNFALKAHHTGFNRGAEFGYNLASKALSDLKAENERLKGLIESIYQAGKYAGHHYSGSEEERYWARFKSEIKL